MTGEARASTETTDLTSIGRYGLALELASGGMATVYLACVRGPGGFEKHVALKRIHKHLASKQQYVEMFLDEARIASRITHPNVCSVLDFGEIDGEYFIVMEYLLGETLNDVLRKVLTTEKPDAWIHMLVHVMVQACEGLHAAHELRNAEGDLLDVVHRDVSPQNLFVGYDGMLRVVDFGIAKAADRVHETESGALKGKWAYMAPEQIREGQVDRRTDVYALGVVLWEALTLRRLFRRKTNAETMYAVLEGKAPPPSSLNGAVPPELDAVVARALAADPEQRYPDARSLGRDLRALESPIVDAGTVSHWMAEAFAEEKKRKRGIMHMARRGAVRETADVPPTVAALQPSSSRTSMWIALALLVVVGVGGGAWAMTQMLGASDETPALATEPETAAHAGSETQTAADNSSTTETETATQTATETATATETETATATEAQTETETQTETQAEMQAARPTKRRHVRTMQTMQTMQTMEVATEATGRGEVVVITPGGWANVYHRRRLLGATPLRTQLPAGSQTIELRMFGEPPSIRKRVNVERDGTTRVIHR